MIDISRHCMFGGGVSRFRHRSSLRFECASSSEEEGKVDKHFFVACVCTCACTSVDFCVDPPITLLPESIILREAFSMVYCCVDVFIGCIGCIGVLQLMYWHFAYAYAYNLESD
jgi:hypothetical protein